MIFFEKIIIFKKLYFDILFGLYALCEKQCITITHKILIVYSLEAFDLETACITVIQAVSQVKCLQEVNYQYFVGECDTFLSSHNA